MDQPLIVPLDPWYWRTVRDPLDRPDTMPFEGALSSWQADGPMPGEWLWCLCRFTLEPTDACVRYWLHVEDAPGPITVMLSGTQVAAAAEGSVSRDVTNHVALEDNEIVLMLDQSRVKAGVRFGRVWLEAVPCEDEFSALP